MAYQLNISVTGKDGEDTSLGPIHIDVPVQLFVEMDGETATYETIKYTERLVRRAVDDVKFHLMTQLVEKLNEEGKK